MCKTFTITCGGKTERYSEDKRKEMIQEYFEAMSFCDGSEAERYTRIYIDLISGEKHCSDDYSKI